MTDKIRIVGSFAEDVVSKVEDFVKGLEGVETVQVLRDGIDTFPHPDEEAAAAAHAPAEEPAAPADNSGTNPAEVTVSAPPTESPSEPDRRVGPADRRVSGVSA